MRNKKKFNEFMNKTIEELKDEATSVLVIKPTSYW